MKKLFISFVLILTIILTGCSETVKIPVGVVPTEKFTIADYVADSAIFQADSSLVIEGRAQTGVVMVASLYDSKNDLVQQVYTDTNKEGVWELKLTTPSASSKNYKLKIADSNNTFFEVFDEIKFGEVWLYLGDSLEVYAESDTTYSTDYNKMIYSNNNWFDISKSNNLFVNELLINLSSSLKNDTPVGVITVEATDSNIYQWLSRDSIDSRNYVKSFLKDNDLYIENDNDITVNDMTYYHQNYLNKISGMSVKNVIWNQGLADTTYLERNRPDVFNNLYFQMLYTFVSDLEHEFNIVSDIYVLQAGSYEIEKIEDLRDVQSNIAKYFGKCTLIPTYDLNHLEAVKCDVEDAENVEIIVQAIDLNLLIERIISYDNNHLKTPCLDNVVGIYNELDEITKYVLTFANVDNFDVIKDIKGLVFYDENNEVIELVYTIEENKIIIDLGIIDNLDETVTYANLTKVTYGNDQLIYDNNLTTEGIPVVPFQILLNKRG